MPKGCRLVCQSICSNPKHAAGTGWLPCHRSLRTDRWSVRCTCHCSTGLGHNNRGSPPPRLTWHWVRCGGSRCVCSTRVQTRHLWQEHGRLLASSGWQQLHCRPWRGSWAGFAGCGRTPPPGATSASHRGRHKCRRSSLSTWSRWGEVRGNEAVGEEFKRRKFKRQVQMARLCTLHFHQNPPGSHCPGGQHSAPVQRSEIQEMRGGAKLSATTKTSDTSSEHLLLHAT